MMSESGHDIQNVFAISLEQVDQKYTPPPLIFEEENSGDEPGYENGYNECVDHQVEPSRKRNKRDDSSAVHPEVNISSGYIEQLLLIHKGIGFNIRDVQIRYGAKTKIKAFMIRDAVINLGSQILCRWKSTGKEYFLKCPPKYISQEVLAKYKIQPAEYEASYNAACKTIPLDKLNEAVEFAASYFPADHDGSTEVAFEIDHSERPRNKTANTQCNSAVIPPLVISKSVSTDISGLANAVKHSLRSRSSVTFPKAQTIPSLISRLETIPSMNIRDETTTSKNIGAETAINDQASSSFDSNVAISLGTDKTVDKQRRKPEKTFQKSDKQKLDSHSDRDGYQMWRDYTEFCAIDKNGKFLGVARYMVPTAQTSKKIVSSYSIEARLNENGEIVSTFKPKEQEKR